MTLTGPSRESAQVRTTLTALRDRVDREVRFDDGSRGPYATDASNVRQVPIGVVVPHTASYSRDVAGPGAAVAARTGSDGYAETCGTWGGQRPRPDREPFVEASPHLDGVCSAHRLGAWPRSAVRDADPRGVA